MTDKQETKEMVDKITPEIREECAKLKKAVDGEDTENAKQRYVSLGELTGWTFADKTMPKRFRAPNYINDEKVYLVHLVLGKLHVIEGNTDREGKDKEWEDIAEKFDERFGSDRFRTAGKLEESWNNQKKYVLGVIFGFRGPITLPEERGAAPDDLATGVENMTTKDSDGVKNEDAEPSTSTENQ